jgi:hypothetical protein
MSAQQHRVMRAIEACRTAALGGHVEVCDRCGERRNAYNSCCNRHCPKCQSLAKERWLEKRLDELLPVEYFHVVFTLPHRLAPLALQNKAAVYGLLFDATAETLARIAADPRHLGAEIGFLAVLHTWGQKLDPHPHLHCIVPGGGFDPAGERWVSCRPGFFLPVRVLSRLFRRLFLDALERAHRRGRLELHGALAPLRPEPAFRDLLAELRASEWVVYAKPPFGGPEKVLEYLGRYTHRVAISNHRLLAVTDDGQVTFRWRDYRHHGRQRTLTLDAEDFIRHFLRHVLPPGFHRIRQFGFLANRHRTEKLERARRLLGAPTPPAPPEAEGDWKDLHQALTGQDLRLCPACGQAPLRLAEALALGPPAIATVEPLDSS